MLNFKKLITATTLATVALLGSEASATSTSPNSFSFGAEGFYYKYREPGLMKDTGSLYGLNADYFYKFSNNFYLGVEGRIDFGKAKYKSNGTGSDKGIKQFIFEQRGLVGYTFKGPTLNTSLFSGLGYRFKSDHSGGKRTSTGHHGYDRHSNYLYLPIGVKLAAKFNDNWDWQSTSEFDILLSGRQKSYTSDRPVEHKQKSGWGVKLDYMVGYNVGKGKIYVGPFFNYWNIKKSKVAHNSLEPKNTTVESGLKAKWSF